MSQSLFAHYIHRSLVAFQACQLFLMISSVMSSHFAPDLHLKPICSILNESSRGFRCFRAYFRRESLNWYMLPEKLKASVSFFWGTTAIFIQFDCPLWAKSQQYAGLSSKISYKQRVVVLWLFLLFWSVVHSVERPFPFFLAVVFIIFLV